MSVDVLYQGVVLARGAEVKAQGSGVFVALEQPMPVGTTVVLDERGQRREFRVGRVQEGSGPGVVVFPLSPSQALPAIDPPATAQEPPATAQEAPTPVVDTAPAAVPAASPPTESPPAAVPAETTPAAAAADSAPGATPVEVEGPRRGVVGPLIDDGRMTLPGIVITPAAPTKAQAPVEEAAVDSTPDSVDGETSGPIDSGAPASPGGEPHGHRHKKRKKHR